MGQEFRPLEVLESLIAAAMAVRAGMAPLILRLPELNWLVTDLTKVFEGPELKTWTPLTNWLLQQGVATTLLAHFYQQHGERCYLFLHLWLRALCGQGRWQQGARSQTWQSSLPSSRRR